MRNNEYSILKSFAVLEETPGVPGLDLPGLGIAALARGWGCRAVDVDTTEELEQEFKTALGADTTTVIVVRTQPQNAMLQRSQCWPARDGQADATAAAGDEQGRARKGSSVPSFPAIVRARVLIAGRARGNPVRSGIIDLHFPERTGVLLPRQPFPGSWVARRRRREASTSASAAARWAQAVSRTPLPGSSSLYTVKK